MILNKNITKDKLYESYYEGLNGILKLTPLELRILTSFSVLEATYPDRYTFDKTNRVIVGEENKVSSFNLNNYIRKLKDRGIFVKDIKSNKLVINPNIFISNDKSYYEIHYKFNII